MKKIILLITSIVLTIQAYAGTTFGDSYFVSANTRTDSLLIRPKNGLITISANKLIVFSNPAVQFTKAVTVQDTIVCDSIILSNGFVISAFTLGKLSGIYLNDSSLLKTAMRSWNASLAKTIDASDTTYWGRAETDPKFTGVNTRIVNDSTRLVSLRTRHENDSIRIADSLNNIYTQGQVDAKLNLKLNTADTLNYLDKSDTLGYKIETQTSNAAKLAFKLNAVPAKLQILQDTGISGQTMLLQVMDSAQYTRFLVTSNGTVVSGRQHKSNVNIDGLALIGTGSLGGKNSISLGYHVYDRADSNFIFGEFIDSTTQTNKMTLGLGISKTQLLSNTTANSVAIGAYETTPGILMTAGKVTIQSVLNSKPRASAPANPVEGDFYVNSTDHHAYSYLSSAWKQLDLQTETDPLSFKLADSTTANGAAKNWKMINLLSTKLATNGSAANLTSFPILNQNTTGTSAGLTAQYIDWNSASGGSSIKNKPTILTTANVGSQIHDTATNYAKLSGATYTGSIYINNPTYSCLSLSHNSTTNPALDININSTYTDGGIVLRGGSMSKNLLRITNSGSDTYYLVKIDSAGVKNLFTIAKNGDVFVANKITTTTLIAPVIISKYDTLSSTATVITYNAAVNPYRTDTIGENHTYTIIGTVNGSKGQLNVTLTATATLSFPAGILADGQTFTSLTAGVYNIYWEKVQNTFNYNIHKYITYTP